jgi:short-subunit dehydrogenase
MEAGKNGFAVVTGASSGIGFELAKVFAEEGYDLLITAEDRELDDAERDLAAMGASVRAVRADLTEPNEVERLWKAIRDAGRPVDAIALNAGIGKGSDFARDPEALDQELEIVDLNCRSTVHLAKRVLKDMTDRNEGKVLFSSSVASTVPGAYQAVYNASKSFVQSFAMALRNELKESNVSVTSLMPGPTETEFFKRADMEDTKIGASEKDDAGKVARQGFDALMSGDEQVVAGSLLNKAQVAASRVLPDAAMAELHRKQAEPGSADE